MNNLPGIFPHFKHLEAQSEERALVYLYTTLITLSPAGADCFLDEALAAPGTWSTDFIVHSLNALSPHKEQLMHWGAFVLLGELQLLTLVGIEDTNTLMKVIL